MHLFAFDVDGTLIDESTDQHSPETISHLQALKARGHKIALLTGRFTLPRALLDLVQPDARALRNGNRIVLGETTVRQHPLSQAEIEAVLQLVPEGMQVVGSALKERPLCFASDHEAPEWDTWRAEDLIHPLAEMHHHDILQIQFRGHEAPLLKARIKEVLPHLNAGGAVAPYLDVLTVTAAQAHKGHALMEIAGLLNVSLEHVTAFGDSDNDLEMLKHAGHAVQVGDAPCLKDICKEQVSCPLIGLPAWLGRQLEGRS